MKKVECPKCGGTLVIESLMQYGRQQDVCKNGKIRKTVKIVDQGPMDFQYLFCKGCNYQFRENEFKYSAGRVELVQGDHKW